MTLAETMAGILRKHPEELKGALYPALAFMMTEFESTVPTEDWLNEEEVEL